MTEDEKQYIENSACSLLDLLDSDFGQSGGDVRFLAIRDQIQAAIEWERSREKWEPCDPPFGGTYIHNHDDEYAYTSVRGQWLRHKLASITQSKKTQVSDKEKP